MKKLVFLLVGLLVFSFTWANFTREFCCDTGWLDTDWTPSPGECCTLPPAPVFPGNPLISATLYIEVQTEQTVGIENTATGSSADVYAFTNLYVYVNTLDQTDDFHTLTKYFPGPGPGNTIVLDQYDGTTDYDGDSGETWADVMNSATWSYNYSGADLAYFNTNFDVCWWTGSDWGVGGTGSSNVVADIETQAWAEACIVYEYEGDPLPVVLSSFTGVYSYNDGTSLLQWTTQSETNNMGWNVYRASNDEFENSMQINISLIEGGGTSSEPIDYEYLDQAGGIVPGQSYWYWLEDVSYDQSTNSYGPIQVDIPEDGYNVVPPEILNTVRLYNTPNPFNPNTVIYFEMEEPNQAIEGEVLIYDIKGNLVKSLYSGYIVSDVGISWDSTDENGKKVSSGIYLYVLKTAGQTYAKKMVLTK